MKNLLRVLMVLGITMSTGVNFNAAEVENTQAKERTLVHSAHCVNMKRDHKYQTVAYFPVKGQAFVKVKNCEGGSGTDKYSGYVDALLERSRTGLNVYKANDRYLKPGHVFNHVVKGQPNNYTLVSTADWEIIDGQDHAGSKRIYASVE